MIIAYLLLKVNFSANCLRLHIAVHRSLRHLIQHLPRHWPHDTDSREIVLRLELLDCLFGNGAEVAGDIVSEHAESFQNRLESRDLLPCPPKGECVGDGEGCCGNGCCCRCGGRCLCKVCLDAPAGEAAVPLHVPPSRGSCKCRPLKYGALRARR